MTDIERLEAELHELFDDTAPDKNCLVTAVAAHIAKREAELREEIENLRLEAIEALTAKELGLAGTRNLYALIRDERDTLFTQLAESRAEVERLTYRAVGAEASERVARDENADLRDTARDCNHDDHQPYCRHYKGLKRENAALREELGKHKQFIAWLSEHGSLTQYGGENSGKVCEVYTREELQYKDDRMEALAALDRWRAGNKP